MNEPGDTHLEHQPDDRFAENSSDDAIHYGENSLPSPERLAQYESVLDGLAERITSNWERSQEHQRNQEEQETANEKMALETHRQVAHWNFSVRIWSLVIAAVIGIGGLIAGIVLTIIYGWSPASLVSLLAALTGLAAVIYGNVRRDGQSPPGA